MKIGISLTMSMAHHVDRDAVDKNREVSAVVGVESAKKNLIGFAAAVMLSNEQPGGESQHIAGSVGRTKLQVFFPSCLFCSRRGRLLSPDVNFDRLGGVRLSLLG